MGTSIGLLQPGEMGAAIGGSLVRAGNTVLWSAAGRSEASRARAEAAGLTATADIPTLLDQVEIVLSIVPPHAALETANDVAGFSGLYVDMNAISPGRAAEVAVVIEKGGGSYVDGGIIGGPPPSDAPRLLFSGTRVEDVTRIVANNEVQIRALEGDPFAASAMKVCYAAWTKGRSAMLLAIRALARANGVEDALVAEWEANSPDLIDASRRGARSAEDRGWRWVGEMAEIASTFRASGLPGGFHDASEEIYRRSPRGDGAANDETLNRVIEALLSEH